MGEKWTDERTELLFDLFNRKLNDQEKIRVFVRLFGFYEGSSSKDQLFFDRVNKYVSEELCKE